MITQTAYNLTINEMLKLTDKELTYDKHVSNNSFRTWLDYFYPCYTLKKSYETEENNITAFENIFELWKTMHAFELNKIINALEIDYEPLENYNKSSVITHNNEYHKGHDSISSIYGVNASTYRPQLKTSTQDTSSTVYDHDEETITDNTHGNIGVTTSQQMLDSELVLRNKARITDIIIKDFVDFALVYNKGVGISWRI